MRYIKAILIIAVLIIIGCARKNDKQLLNSAEEKLRANNTAGAIAEYKSLLQDFPSSASAVQALMSLGNLYHAKLDSTVNEQKSYMLAVEYYERLVKTFPSDSLAPRAQFMIGFIYANELKRPDAAKAAYDKFIHDYPQNELVQSAKDEIKYMGVAPEDIINSQHDSGRK